MTGATGFLGRALCRELTENGHEVTAIVRPESAEKAKDLEVSRVIELPLEELDSLQAVSEQEEIPDEKLTEFSVLESFSKDRLKTLIDKVIVYGSDAIEIVWKVGNPFVPEINV